MTSATCCRDPMSAAYQSFLETKALVVRPSGRLVEDADIHPKLFPFQRDLVRWSVAKGRAAIFADTGLGKSYMLMEWARLLDVETLVVAPLSVARQLSRMASDIGLSLPYSRNGDPEGQLTVTNYEMLHKFSPDHYGAVVLDESSILKNYAGSVRTALIEWAQEIPNRLACTATPAPNDIAELANHAEFLGIMSRVEMLAAFFVHDDAGWRLKGHAAQPFYRWLASWAMSVQKPSDLGYDDEGFALPKLSIEPIFIESDYQPEDRLFAYGLSGITERSEVARDTVEARCAAAAELVNGSIEPVIVWVGRNDESSRMANLIPDSVEVVGSQTPEEKAELLEGFQDGKYRVLVTKPSIAGFGMNFQHCARVVFVGLNDSYEQYYQAIRRCYRYGQTRPVGVTVVLAEEQRPVFDNVIQKEGQARIMSQELVRHVAEFEKAELAQVKAQEFDYKEDDAEGNNWRLMLGDSCTRLSEVEDESVGLSVFSPPFLSLYTYSPTERDLGNSGDPEKFWSHFDYISKHLYRVTKPGRNVCIHVAQISTTKTNQGFIGLQDFRGDTIKHFQEAGFRYYGEVAIDKDPQAQAIRTKASTLLFVQLHRDSAASRPALADYIIIMKKPGDNAEPINPDIDNNQWIEWARPIWYGIRETETLNYREARSEDDERHIAPLQLGTIERCVRLWSNPGDTVLSPFAGIGSEGYVSLMHGRKFIGCELKPEYWRVGVKNLRKAENRKESGTLLDLVET